ncbi:MAG: exo 1,3/1,4-beta-D-glucan glucohydrolase [Candidatus Nanopelagicales bacterium]|nr:exo 1,3/1,4-beta-D-glucan glucohydrolase [Candidatus Nanopelagicales bacterium]
MTADADTKIPRLTFADDWPRVKSAVAYDPDREAFIADIVSRMTLEEKVGQMIQPDLREVTPDEVTEYRLGTILNGGGAFPGNDKYATAADWAQAADTYYHAGDRAYEGRGFRVPFAWATDAVHGHNNVFGATLFPHNIGLGAARDPDLVRRIGAATAAEITATGLDWTFAPTVAVPRDYRWGRVYEGYSEDPAVVHAYASAMVDGLQGQGDDRFGPGKVVSTVKHWVGDGGTSGGVDRGENHYTEDYLINLHAVGYASALDAGAQVVMSSFNSWHNDKNYDLMGAGNYNYKIHGSRYLIQDVLKDKMGFDGVVVTDWNGHSELNDCTPGNCPQVILAGNDLIMVTARPDWQAFYRNTIDQVRDGTIPMARIDDAVTRILRVKHRAGLWDKPSPADRVGAGQQDTLGSSDHRELAREAVRRSLVLLKNDQILPLGRHTPVLVVGSGADDIQKQTGGWSLTWQGNENVLEKDFPGATTVLSATQGLLGDDRVVTEVDRAGPDTVALVVIGEDPYAEMLGDIGKTKTLEYSELKRSYRKDLQLIRDLRARGHRVVTVFYSGRPLYVSEELTLSDAFVAAWLPGTEATGITDLLFSDGTYGFTGRLPYSWPANKCDNTINSTPAHLAHLPAPESEQTEAGGDVPLFPLGYGLSIDDTRSDRLGVDTGSIALDTRDYGCGMPEPDQSVANEPLDLFSHTASDDFVMYIGGTSTDWRGVAVSRGSVTEIDGLLTTPIDRRHQQDAVRVEFAGNNPAQVYLNVPDGQPMDLKRYLNAGGSIEFELAVDTEPRGPLRLAMHCVWPCIGEVDLAGYLSEPSDDTGWVTVTVPLADLDEAGMDFASVTTPFLVYADSPLTVRIGRVRLVP